MKNQKYPHGKFIPVGIFLFEVDMVKIGYKPYQFLMVDVINLITHTISFSLS